MTDMAGNFFSATIFLPPLCQTPSAGEVKIRLIWFLQTSQGEVIKHVSHMHSRSCIFFSVGCN